MQFIVNVNKGNFIKLEQTHLISSNKLWVKMSIVMGYPFLWVKMPLFMGENASLWVKMPLFMPGSIERNVDPDEMPLSAASYQCLHCCTLNILLSK